MANYYSMARSNYFKVVNDSEFEEWADRRCIEYQKKENGTYVLLADEGWSLYDPETEEEYDIAEELQGFIEPGDVAVLIEIGWEKLRYLTAEAVAVSSKEIEHVDLYRIYDLAHRMGDGRDITAAEY